MAAQPSFSDAVEGAVATAGEDALVNALLPSKHADPDVRDKTDAAHADAAFTGILGATVATVSATIHAATIATTLGIGTPAVFAAIGSAAALIRAAWAAMSYREKARIWRGEITR